ncbi:class I adenylate-forming enzyme family protein [Oceanicaulis alexandrii]|uniref:class I adenylate-forming enzyme family protein n=1 Tax=Oceanicaulis alexandrii TaxID=153233 RepID=UPI003B512255
MGGSAWPVLSVSEARKRLCEPGSLFEFEVREINGAPVRVWKNGPQTLPDLVRAAVSHGDREFLVLGDERVSFRAFCNAAALLAQTLRARGVTKGDRVAIAMRNLPEFPVAFFAAAAVGAIIVPLNAWWTADELAYALDDSGARSLICDAERWAVLSGASLSLDVLVCSADAPVDAERLEDVIGAPNDWAALADQSLPDVDIAADDPATLFYTSGTTGRPKGALGTHRSSMSNVLATAYAGAFAALRRGEPVPEPQPRASLLPIPLFHVAACNARMLSSLHVGHTMVLMNKWDPLEALQIIEREKIAYTGGVPAIAWSLLEHPQRGEFDLSSLEGVAYGGAPAAPELVRRLHEDLGCEPGTGWGMTETSGTVTRHDGEDYLNRPGSCGPPVAVAELKIMSLDGANELETGEVGELWARGPMVVTGYWNKPDATADTFIDGWVRTGDVARLDEDGFCYIVDRSKDVIIRGGENIYPVEVENRLYEHPAVVDAAVAAIPHQILGEEPAALITLSYGASVDEPTLQAFVRERLAGFKTPVLIQVHDAPLPRNASGKILKAEVRKILAAESARRSPA